MRKSENHFHAGGSSSGHLETEIRPQAQRSKPEIAGAARAPTAAPDSAARALLYPAVA